MIEHALTLNLKDDPKLIEQYVRYHQNAWPEVKDNLKKIGITKMHIYLVGRKLFMVMETVDNFDPETDFAKYLSLDPKCQEWEDLMGTFQEKIPEAKGDEKWVAMKRIFELT